jgi:hypothetical protein
MPALLWGKGDFLCSRLFFAITPVSLLITCYRGTWLQYPFALALLPPEGAPFPSDDAVESIKPLLEQGSALAATAHAVSLHPESHLHDISGTRHVLSEHLRATLAVFRRWHQDNHPHIIDQGDGA